MEIGNIARVKQPVIQGEITDTRYDKEARQLEHLVTYTDGEGQSQERWFKESELDEVTA